ncbi:M28 family peptidase [Rhodohalobacter sp. SW132]|uniref:M28 family peptidase n=2 Tax=Rhodohalobacter sp. SW132 TaxID=2293433 RepID=UPI001FD84F1F|nr:M28 family peptidase [Rhodohalobacter sp. SW132]
MMKISPPVLVLSSVLIVLLFVSCGEEGAGLEFEQQDRAVPEFNADNAYQFIEDQVNFGPRVPNSSAHVQTKDYIRDQLAAVAGDRNVFVQEFQQEVYGEELTMFNILASFGVHHEDRIVLAAHWDTRPRAEEDPVDPESPILGADDGGSGVGVLLEMARIFSENEPPIGVDIVFFDGEDYGEVSDLDNYFLGARQWGNHPPVPGYSPRFGILLDMVGGENAIFSKEGYSMRFAPNLVNEIWRIGDELGYGHFFVDQRGGNVADDHIIVQQLTGIPMINIIHHTPADGGGVQFPPYWHTHNDTMEIIDRETLQAVGDVVLELIYNRIPT